MTARKASRYANYNGDLTATAVGTIVGPNTLGERLIAVDAVYDATTNRTRVGYAYATVEEVEELEAR